MEKSGLMGTFSHHSGCRRGDTMRTNEECLLWENLNPRWIHEWHSLPPRVVDMSRNCVCYCFLCFSPLCDCSTLRTRLCVAPVGDRLMFKQMLHCTYFRNSSVQAVLHADRQEVTKPHPFHFSLKKKKMLFSSPLYTLRTPQTNSRTSCLENRIIS